VSPGRGGIERQQFDLSEILHNIDGEVVLRKDGRGPARVYLSSALRVHIILQDVSRHTKEGKHLRRLGRMTAQYEAAQEGETGVGLDSG
jgi:hypothetical protein